MKSFQKHFNTGILLIGALGLHAWALAPSDQECRLMKERISGSGQVNAICSNIYQVCSAESVKKADPKDAQNQCLKNLGDCQMAGQLSGDDLQRVVDQYQALCGDR